MSLPLENDEVQSVVEGLVSSVEADHRFVYYLMGATGIVVVPLTSFCCERNGFRITLLECDDERRRWTFRTIGETIREYLASGSRGR